ncbi:MAG: hypothetical protein Q4E35_07190 [Eubacteriales bacterium]|nr:hypothetical protein [Eubacteriales bacterium]
MTEELKSKQLSDDELEDVNGGAGLFDWLKDKTGKTMRVRSRFGLNNNAQEEAELRSNSRTPI